MTMTRMMRMKMRMRMLWLLQAGLLLLLMVQVAAAAAAAAATDSTTTTTTAKTRRLQDDEEPPTEVEDKQSWYKRYPRYPDYCSTPEQMDRRGIPPLKEEEITSSEGTTTTTTTTTGNTRLVHVTAILRHGARTILQGPSDKNYQCWDDYWTNPETAVWDCPLKTLVMPPSPERIVEEEEEDFADTADDLYMQEIPKSMFLFTKDYDALQSPQSNVLNGTCELGQLILQGYEQQVKNGQFLRDAYLFEEGEYAPSTRLQLFQVGGEDNPEPWASVDADTTTNNNNNNLYLRSDNSQSTLMSGQLLMRGLFEKELIRSREERSQNYDYYDMWAGAFPTIPVHTADHARDILGGFREHCEALTELQAASDQSWEYQQFADSAETQAVLGFLGRHLHDEGSLLDCLMTTVCTDRPLPDRFGIYNPHPNSWFNRIAAYHAKNHSFHLQYNDAEFSKLSMGPLWAEIMDHINPVLSDEMENQDRPRPPAQLAIYSGYDSTIMEVLSSLGAWAGEEWPPYASMVLLEIHELLDDARDKSIFESQFAFRLLYNGQVLTDKVEGCTANMELCDAQHLVNRVTPFARRNVDCIDVNLEKNKIHPTEVAKLLLTTTGGIILVLLIVAVSALAGSIAVFYHLTGSVPTEELKSIKRQVFKGKNGPNGNAGLSDSDDLASISSNRSNSLVLDEHDEMNMSDAAAVMEDFDDEPVENDD